VPHFTIEYSANLDGVVDIRALCRLILKTAMGTGLFELGALRVRAFRSDNYAIADEAAENGFIDMSFRIGAGRSPAEKKAAGDAIFAAVETFVADQLAQPHFALSLEIREIDPALSWKKNSIHPRLRAK
jgi:5-carboxymethyl-2-hydroxymuconate isomerase